MSFSVVKDSLFKIKFLNLSSICIVALGNLSLYKVFIMTISLSIKGVRIGLLNSIKAIFSNIQRNIFVGIYLKDLDLGLMEGDLLPSSSKAQGLESFDEKCLFIFRSFSVAGFPMARPEGPIRCSLSWEEHWDWKYSFLEHIVLKIYSMSFDSTNRNIWASRCCSISGWGQAGHWPTTAIHFFDIHKGKLKSLKKNQVPFSY